MLLIRATATVCPATGMTAPVYRLPADCVATAMRWSADGVPPDSVPAECRLLPADRWSAERLLPDKVCALAVWGTIPVIPYRLAEF